MLNFDSNLKGALDIAQVESINRNHNEITENHFIYGLILLPNTVISKHLVQERKLIEGILDSLPQVEHVSLETLQIGKKLHEWFTLASAEAAKEGKEEISEHHFIKHLLKFFPQIKLDIDIENQENQIISKPDFLEDLNEIANTGKLDPVIGRSTEIRQVMEILCRRTKNNPVLVGLPGVGKTAIVEGLAGLIIAGNVPDIIQGKTIYSMNMGSLMTNTKYRGEFEEKIEQLLQFLKSKERDAILFIDEIHLLIGAGKTDGAIDAANLLKPALARGDLNCIGATTLDEYKKFIESDSALERRLHMVRVEEPTKEDTIQILIGLREKLEIHHSIEITDEAIIAAVYLTDQYITDRFLPDKAIDVIDEAAASLKLSADSTPVELQELDSLIKSKKILAQTKQYNENLKKEIEKLEIDYQQGLAEWNQKTAELKKATALKKELDEAQFLLRKAQNESNFEKASRIQYGIIPDLDQRIENMNISWKLKKSDIGEVITKITGIPTARILKTEQENIIGLGDYLKKFVFGQNQVLDEISDILIASHSGLSDQTKPLGSFLLLGPSGVGKTETAKALAKFLFGNEKNLIRIDLSEYRESHSISKLIGAPPGYVGYEKGGKLTEEVRRKPYSVLLFDEIEKAHDDFADILLQILDDGRLTDSQGKLVNFKNTVIFITSNLKDYTTYLKPEVIGRLDAILQFNSLNKEIITQLIQREMKLLESRLQDKEIKIFLDPSVVEKIYNLGFDERYGARPLKNAFNKLVIRPLSKVMLSNLDIKGNFLIKVNEQTNQIDIQHKL